jgi:hypothetical protein
VISISSNADDLRGHVWGVRAARLSAPKQRGEIATPVGNTKNLHFGADCAVHDHVVADRKASPASSKIFIPSPPKPRLGGKKIKPACNRVDLAIGYDLVTCFPG